MENTITHQTQIPVNDQEKKWIPIQKVIVKLVWIPAPRFLIIESTDSDKPLTKLSPFALQKGIKGLAGVPKDVNRLRSGHVLIEVDCKSHCRNLLQSNMIVDASLDINHSTSKKV